MGPGLASNYSKTCLKWPLKKIFKTDYRLMQVKSIAECVILRVIPVNDTKETLESVFGH